MTKQPTAKLTHIKTTKYKHGLYKDDPALIERFNQLNREKDNNKDYAAQGNVFNSLGLCYLEGLGTPQNYEMAFKCFLKADILGNDEATVNLAMCYMRGYGVMQDERQAVDLLDKAYMKGNSRAIVNLGFCFERGLGVRKPDPKRAFLYYKKAETQQYLPAKNYLVRCYKYGIGVTKDENKAFELCYEAAQAGDRMAQKNLKLYYSAQLKKKNQETLQEHKAAPQKTLDERYEEAKENAQRDKSEEKEKKFTELDIISPDFMKEFFWSSKELETRIPLFQARPFDDPQVLRNQAHTKFVKRQIKKNSNELAKISNEEIAAARQIEPNRAMQLEMIAHNEILNSFYKRVFHDLYQAFSAAIVLTSGSLGLTSKILRTDGVKGSLFDITDLGADFLKNFPITEVILKVLSKNPDVYDKMDKLSSIFDFAQIVQAEKCEPSILCKDIARTVTMAMHQELLENSTKKPSELKFNLRSEVDEEIFEEMSRNDKSATQVKAGETVARILEFLFTKKSQHLAKEGTAREDVVVDIYMSLGLHTYQASEIDSDLSVKSTSSLSSLYSDSSASASDDSNHGVERKESEESKMPLDPAENLRSPTPSTSVVVVEADSFPELHRAQLQKELAEMKKEFEEVKSDDLRVTSKEVEDVKDDKEPESLEKLTKIIELEGKLAQNQSQYVAI